MQVITTLTKEQLHLLKMNAVLFTDKEGVAHWRLPQWYKKVGTEEFEEVHYSEFEKINKEWVLDVYPEIKEYAIKLIEYFVTNGIDFTADPFCNAGEFLEEIKCEL